MNPLEQKIKELIGDVNTSEEDFDYYYTEFVTEKMKLLARHIFNEFYPHESTGEVEPWATKEQQEGQETWASGFNTCRAQIKENAFTMGILKK